MKKLQEFNPLYSRFGHLSLLAMGLALILLGFIVRNDAYLTLLSLALQIVGWAAIIVGAAIAIAGVAAYGHQRKWWDPLITTTDDPKKASPIIRLEACTYGETTITLIPWHHEVATLDPIKTYTITIPAPEPTKTPTPEAPDA